MIVSSTISTTGLKPRQTHQEDAEHSRSALQSAICWDPKMGFQHPPTDGSP
jgi:hypothetical protein